MPRREKGKGRGKRRPSPLWLPPAPTIPAPLLAFQRPPQAVAGPYSGGVDTRDGTSNREKTREERRACKEAGTRLPSRRRAEEKSRQVNPRRSPVRCRRPCLNGDAMGRGGQKEKKGKSTAAPTTTAQPPKPSRRKEPTTATICGRGNSLTPAAVAKGLTYKGVLTDAQNRVDLTGLDISRLKPKFTATGAPLGKYVGLKKAQLERDRLQRKRRGKTQRRSWRTSCNLSSRRSPRISDTEEDRPVLKEDLRTSQKALNWVTDKIVKYVEQPESAVIARLEEEIKKWQEHSARLEANMKAMKEENATLKRRLEDLEASANKSSTEEMLAMVEARVQARLESALMGPAQRPTLAHERRTATGDTELPVTSGYVGGAPNTQNRPKAREKGKRREQPNPLPLPPPPLPQSLGPPARRHNPSQGPSTAPATTTASTAKKTQDRRRETPKQKPQKGKKNGPPPAQPAPEPRVLPPAPANVDTPWVEVVRRKKKGKPAAAPTNSTQPPKPTRRKEPKLRPPRSAAVVISPTPAAIAKGLSLQERPDGRPK
ncbi:serine/arginine repetitive matrix protein 1-like [Manduca sexta]|uniref:serine/arginine repetitive matrix protein 1-like n=1 Tax=Manduca sexta TaxID=7130 RepID=UPI00188E4EEB|nr:serine/arginine repetitive matrix protein 1-like [Manduca sexta]